ncbi:MAG TPA: hypothetical protein VGP82_10760 [Ktedonobacterales bacterium]|jgi:hypothetical protein|nr:hypothetical protein [Ktedonobacterales bacterium]
MPLLIAALLGISALFIVTYPLLGLERASAEGDEPGQLADLADRERAAKEALRDVEFDRQLGNLEEPDYQALRDRYERRAIVALGARYRREQELDALIERQMAELRTKETVASPEKSAAESATIKATNGVTQAKPAQSPKRQARRRRRA